MEPTSTPILDYGKLTRNVYTFEEPGGETMEEILPQGQIVACDDNRVNHSGYTYYSCTWEYHGDFGEGWIIGTWIEFDQ